MGVSVDNLQGAWSGSSAAPYDHGGSAGDRTPPQDLAAEQSVLGAMLLSKDAIGEVTEVLKGETSTGWRTS